MRSLCRKGAASLFHTVGLAWFVQRQFDFCIFQDTVGTDHFGYQLGVRKPYIDRGQLCRKGAPVSGVVSRFTEHFKQWIQLTRGHKNIQN